MSRADQTAPSHTHLTTTAVGGRGGISVRLAPIASVAMLVLAPSIGLAHEDTGAHDAADAHCPMHPEAAQSAEEHSAETHTAAAHSAPASSTPTPASSRTTSSVRDYSVPAVQLVRDDGKPVSLTDEMNDGRPIVMNFIFTTCTTICPVMSNVFAQFERRLGPDAEKVHLMSISIDPERDTPERLVEYARRFHAGPEWRHYTGTLAASIAVQQAFDAYRGSKMSHTPLTLMRASPGKPWLRIDGFASPDDLVRDYRELLAAR